jgi:N utilization substance protein B
MNEKKRHSKYYSRTCAVQALYQWQHTGQNDTEIIEQFATDGSLKLADRKYFKKLVVGVIDQHKFLDDNLSPHLHREVHELTPVELAILRLAAYELLFCLETPYKVAINEALEIAKDFGADKSYKFVNAVLDALAQQSRRNG